MYEKIRGEIKQAMRDKNTLVLNTLRGLLSAMTNESVAKGRKPDQELSEEEILAVVKRLAKQRKDSIEQFQKGGRNDLVEVEENELEIIKKYLPEEVGEDEIRKVVEQKKTELGITDKTKIGILVGAVMKELKGRADGGEVKRIVEESF